MGATILLLVCEVIISQLCKSLITMVDGFHTLFILVRMALPTVKPRLSSSASPMSPSCTSSFSSAHPPSAPVSIKLLPCTQAATHSSSTPVYHSTSQSASHQLSPKASHSDSPKISPPSPPPSPPLPPPPPSLLCGLSYTDERIQTVGALISALLLASLCISYCLEILSHTLQPHPIQRPLLVVVVGAISLLHKLLLFGLSWYRTTSHHEVKGKVLAEEEPKSEQGCVVDDVNKVQSAVDSSLHNGTLVLCNPGTSSVPDGDSQTPEEDACVLTGAPQSPSSAGFLCADPDRLSSDSCKCNIWSRVTDPYEARSEVAEDRTCMGHLDSQNQVKTSSGFLSPDESYAASSQSPACLPSLLAVTQAFSSSVLALTNSLLMLLISSDCVLGSHLCSRLIYLDPAFSLLAIIVLVTTALPQVYKYGLLLLQATPPQVCVSDVRRRIISVPGVQSVHDLHIWQLTDLIAVASVHVHCHAGLPTHRCPDVMSEVTQVLRSAGVTCSTVQPEFPLRSVSPASSLGDTPPILHRETPSLPPLLACSLACGKACAATMCCSPPAEKSRELLAPPAGEMEEEPQVLIIENTFL
ncbi:hypothetical protein LDENG_00269450 [Lucifuga dentata]|nr:hypothetical protein LDENG_00269450 [Lucifuga dentata]